MPCGIRLPALRAASTIGYTPPPALPPFDQPPEDPHVHSPISDTGGDSVVVLADAASLAALAGADLLDVPLRFGPVVVPDTAEAELGDDDAALADKVSSWIEANGIRAGARTWVVRAPVSGVQGPRLATDDGRLVPGGTIDHALLRWLRENVLVPGGSSLVVAEGGSLSDLMQSTALPDGVAVLDAAAFLRLAAGAGHLPDEASGEMPGAVSAGPGSEPATSLDSGPRQGPR